MINDAMWVFIGQAVVYLAALFLVAGSLVFLLLLYSLKTERFFFPTFTLALVVFFEGLLKAFFNFFHLDSTAVDFVVIDLKNKISSSAFNSAPNNRVALFLPQCLRAKTCPAKLSPQGIQCVSCGACEIHKAKKVAEDLGYMFFLIPGGSFIPRLVREHKPMALLGVGCRMEVRQGFELCEKINMPARGILLLRDGCVETDLDWDLFYRTIKREKVLC
ncbi:MAG: DUF116 domain-containing protein [Candidatus Diapherotrites archaeon]|nr:DUF116 domain-containing protein [Candidatus Diapherotrites archaeon]